MALVGYARVSSVGQSLKAQRDKLKHCDKVFEEQKSGTADQPPRLFKGGFWASMSIASGKSIAAKRMDF